MKPWAYYNENDPFAAEWGRELIKRGLVAPGEIDERSIVDVEASEIRGFTQHHFFAGILGWSHALRLAGWPDDKPVLTGSPPCQSFSVAGKQLGVKDPRHLAPHFLELVAALRPPVVFGEQVSAAVKKDMWLDDLLDALEREGYATGAAVLPACGVGAPHIRQRIWFVGRLADSTLSGDRAFDRESRSGIRRQGEVGRHGISGGLDKPQKLGSQNRKELYGTHNRESSYDGCESGGLDDATGARQDRPQQNAESDSRDEARLRLSGAGCESGGLADATPNGRGQERTDSGGRCKGDRAEGLCAGSCSGGCAGGLGNTEQLDPRRDTGTSTEAQGRTGMWAECDAARPSGAVGGPCPTHGGWETVDWLFCRDGKWRPAQPGIQPLAHGLPKGVVRGSNSGEPDVEATQEARVMRLRGYGNAILPQVAAEIIREVM